jgi:hypothetical protein
MAMVTKAPVRNEQQSDLTIEQKLQKVRELYADAPEIGRTALENNISGLRREIAEATGTQRAGRFGARRGQVSEFTLVMPFAPGGAKRLRGFLQLMESNFQAADLVGTVHDMRFVFLDNDTKLLFATAFDGDWDAYIEDFAAKIPNPLDVLLCNFEGFPGIRHPSIKDWIAKYQITADSWYVASPNLTVGETRRLERVGKALDEFLDKVSK